MTAFPNVPSSIPAAPPTTPGEIPSRPTRWPTTLGVIAIIFGALGMLSGAWSIVAALFIENFISVPGQSEAVMQSMSAFRPYMLIYAILAIVLAVALLIGGIKLTQRRARGLRLLRIWSILKIVLVAIGATIVYIAQESQFQAMRQDPLFASNPMFRGGMQMFIRVLTAILTVAWGWALPIFLLCWLSRPKIKREMGMWN